MRAAAQMAASSPAAVEGTLEAASLLLHLPSSSVGIQKEGEGRPCLEAVEGILEEVAVAAAQ